MKLNQYIRKKEINISENDRASQLSNLVTEARLYAGLTQAELATKMGTKQPSIARAESGEVEPSIEFLEKVAVAAGTRLVYPKLAFMIENEKIANSKIQGSLKDFSHARVRIVRTAIWNPFSSTRYWNFGVKTEGIPSRLKVFK